MEIHTVYQNKSQTKSTGIFSNTRKYFAYFLSDTYEI